jgi:hypothetical protein
MGQGQKTLQHTKFVHDFQRRRMDGVAPKITEKVGVFLQHRNVDASAGQ